MIGKINLFENVKTTVINKINKLTQPVHKFNIPKLKQLKQDIFELKEGTPDVLPNNPPIVIGRYNSGIKDDRFVLFATEYRAYEHEGYDGKFPNNYVCIDKKGDRRLKPHVYISIIEVKKEYARQGAYSEAIKKLIEHVKNDKECEGRIILSSIKISTPNTAKIPSPSLAHWKSGFRFADEKNNKIMQNVLEGKLPLEDAPEGYMYYPLK